MSATRYGRIYHAESNDYNYINLRFKSGAQRDIFAVDFKNYHASHEHDGVKPRFENITAAEIGNLQAVTVHDADEVTLDGYTAYEIERYHQQDSISGSYRYSPPTCCVAPTISIDRTFTDSATLERHELSAIFGDMPDKDFEKLLNAVQTNGFIDPVIRIIGNQVLDGWHRYRAAQELNLLRKLRFEQWDTEKEGDPADFVVGRNLNRRHQSADMRAQILLEVNERFRKGNIKAQRSGSSTDEPKTRQEIADEAGVSTATLDRAARIKKMGRQKEVLEGKKTAGEVLKEEKLKKAHTDAEDARRDLWKTFHASDLDTGKASEEAFAKAASRQYQVDTDELFIWKAGFMEIETLTPEEAVGWKQRMKQMRQDVIDNADWVRALAEVSLADPEREAAIAVVEPSFRNAVETWRSSQIDRLRKFEKLPVGRTPLLESEYIKTYFELADPRIPQNTKPTDAHYEGTIECMRDRPVAFAEQLEGRHYRRIIKDWDESVLPQLIKRFQGPLLGYPTSQLKADAFEVRIRQAIREQYEFQGRIPSQPFEVLFEITEDAHAVLVQLNPKEWVREGREISWAVSVLPEPIDTPTESEEMVSDEKTAGEAISEETVKGLWGLVTAEMKAWKARDKEKCKFPSDHVGKASKSMLITALRKYEESDDEGAATARELRDLLRLMKTDSFAFTLNVRTVLSDELKTERELESAHGTAENDRRRVWIAFGESDISNAISKEAFALAAAKQLGLYEDGYGSGENYLLGKDYAPIDKLNLKEAQQIRAFFNSVEAALKARPDWIQTLMPTEQASDEEVSPMPPVLDAFNERHLKWKAWYAESGYEENELIQASTEADLLDALRVYRGSDREGMPTADEVKDMTNLMKQQSYPLAIYLRNLLREKSEKSADESECLSSGNDLPLVANPDFSAGVSDTPAPPADEGETEQDLFHDVDLAAVKADLEALLKKVMPAEKHPLWHQICEDINDAYLDYENLPNDREIFAILLDCALSAIEEISV